jgi:hypothetical protein
MVPGIGRFEGVAIRSDDSEAYGKIATFAFLACSKEVLGVTQVRKIAE